MENVSAGQLVNVAREIPWRKIWTSGRWLMVLLAGYWWGSSQSADELARSERVTQRLVAGIERRKTDERKLTSRSIDQWRKEQPGSYSDDRQPFDDLLGWRDLPSRFEVAHYFERLRERHAIWDGRQVDCGPPAGRPHRFFDSIRWPLTGFVRLDDRWHQFSALVTWNPQSSWHLQAVYLDDSQTWAYADSSVNAFLAKHQGPLAYSLLLMTGDGSLK